MIQWNIYTQIYICGLILGMIFMIFINQLISHYYNKKVIKFLGEKKLLNKYYDWKRYQCYNKKVIKFLGEKKLLNKYYDWKRYQ